MRLLKVFSAAVFAIVLVGCGEGSGDSTSFASSSSTVSSAASSSTASSASSSATLVLSVEMDKEIKNIMLSTGATAVTLAVAKNGQIEYEQAYGFQDAEKTIALKADALMRTASIVKPVTAAGVHKLVANGVLSLSDHAFCTGSNTPCWLPQNLLSEGSDIRVKDITIKHLLSHQGGWYRDISGDPIGEEAAIRDLLNLSGPPTREDIVRHVMERPLDYAPGTPDYRHINYTNFDYLLLGMIIEQAAHTNYLQYVQSEIMAPMGVGASEFKVAQIKPEDRDAREPNYISTDICPSIFTKGKQTLCADEGADLQNWASALGAITTPRTMALFAHYYRLPIDFGANYGVIGEARVPDVGYKGMHGGGGVGLSSVVRQLPSGVTYSIFFNIEFDLESRLVDLDRISQLNP